MKRGGFLTRADREALSKFPSQIDADDIRRCFTLIAADFGGVIDRRYGAAGKLAGGLQIGAVRLLGFVPSDLSSAPPEVVRFVGNQVGASALGLDDYTTRRSTRAEHVAHVERYLGFRRAGRGDLKMLGDWLTERALEHDRPGLLLRLACDFLTAESVIRPAVTTVERSVIGARQRATAETYQRLASQLAEPRRRQLDQLLVVAPELGVTRLVWLRRHGSGSVATKIKGHLARIDLLRSIGAADFDIGAVNPNRIRHLAGLGRRMKPQTLANLQPDRRYQILVATVVDELVRLTDETLDLFDAAMATLDRRARFELEAITKANASVANNTVRLFGQVARILLDPTIPDGQVRTTIFNQTNKQRFAEATERAAQIERPPDSSYIDLLCARYRYARRFAPHVLTAFAFHAATPNDPLLAGG